jgi:alpha-1,6-mannosyltransferase
MVVLDVSGFYSEVCGGIKTYYRAKAQHLPARGVECHFAVPARSDGSMRFGDGVLHGVAGPPIPVNPHYRLFPGISRLRQIIRAVEPDIIEVGSHYLLPSLVRCALDRPRPLVGFYHADFPRTYVEPLLAAAPATVRRRAVGWAWGLVRRQHARYAATLAASTQVAEALRRHAVPSVRWVGLGVDVETFRPPRARIGPPTVIYAGRLAADKGFPTVLAAWERIHRHTGARLVIAGDGPLRQKAACAGAAVELRGYVDSPAEMARLYGAADLALAPGPHESFSLAAAEALACETPVVAADRCGNAELVGESGGGVLFTAERADRLADAVIALLGAGEAERRRLGARGRAHVVERLTWPQVFARIFDLYRELTD